MNAGQSQQRALGYGLVCAAALLYGLDGVLIKGIRWDSMGISGSRSFFLVLTLIVYARGRLRLHDRRIWIGAILIAATGVLYPLAVRNTTFANALILFYTTTIWIVFWEWWETGQIRRANIIVLPIIVLGELFMLADKISLGSGLIGNVLALVSGFTYSTAMYVLLIRKPRSGVSDRTSSFIFEAFVFGYLISALFTLPWIIQNPPPADTQTLVALVALGVIAMGLPKIFEVNALERLSPFECGIVMSFMEPIVGIALVYFKFGECPDLFAWIGAPLVICSIVLREYLLYREKSAVAADFTATVVSPGG